MISLYRVDNKVIKVLRALDARLLGEYPSPGPSGPAYYHVLELPTRPSLLLRPIGAPLSTLKNTI